VVPVTCFITIPAYEFVCRLNCAEIALDIGFFLVLISEYQYHIREKLCWFDKGVEHAFTEFYDKIHRGGDTPYANFPKKGCQHAVTAYDDA